MKNLLVAVSLAGLSMASVNAMAGDDFAKYDTDGSGTINMSEAQAHTTLAEQFEALDADANGELSETEFANFKG
ncbi:EF-hand domain-containing protein [Pseudoalteromonas sp. McH1-7]|uniref:EF-hand domain-containing protein n=1 Tax=unclassified Pseudoalteromonas TaxID=194690 RepID=UPI000FFE5425|nr:MULTISPECIES: EF-hand domain-containing protein [unclassified Pseudoalteromonas]NUZ12641.1 EF-hand domain-containing protein [Pseudoalteromonas sp. McH1-7]RXE99036.1 EF-hand domain-containing protein [Pseudoalteromonas sp. PS5]